MKNSYANESRGRYKVIHHTKWSKGGGIEVSTRLVVIEFTSKKGYGDWAFRTQRRDDGSTYGGSAFDTERSAHNAFLRRYLEHNASYREGNVSHYPGIVK